MKNLPDDEHTILTRLIPTVQRLQNDSRGLIQWIATLNDQERRVLLHLAQQQAPWLVSAIQRVPPSMSDTAKTIGHQREASG